jgi:AcrR family transcriptional regulator
LPIEPDAPQRERLLGGMVAAAASTGYARASIAEIIARAGVSRRTFYEHFANREQCFISALAAVQERLLDDVRRSMAADRAERALQAALAGLTSFADSSPAEASFLTEASLCAGPAALELRDAGIVAIERAVQARYRGLPPSAAVPDVSARMLVGGLYRLLCTRRRRGEAGVSGLRQDLSAWLAAYGRPLGEHRWRTLEPLAVPPPAVRSPPLLSPPALASDRTGVSQHDLAENRRLRILFAAAELAESGGYRSATIARITELAGVDGRAFRLLFASKEEAFGAVHELYFQHLMSAVAGAFFTSGTWPERVWAGGEAFVQTCEQNPTLAHIGFVEAYAAGPAAEQRVDDFLTAFTVFLQEGYAYERPCASEPPPRPPSGTGLQMIAASIYEAAYLQVRATRPIRLSGLLPHVIHLCLAPFLGPEEANHFIDQKLSAASPRG